MSWARHALCVLLQALDNYKRACNCGRGALFFSVARGKVGCCFFCWCCCYIYHCF